MQRTRSEHRLSPCAAAHAGSARPWAGGSACIALALACLHAAAQPPAPQHAAAQASAPKLEFDIPAGPLVDVLLALGHTAGVLVSFNPALVLQAQAPAIRGVYTVQEAAALATRASGLLAEVTASGTLTVTVAPPQEPVPAPPAAAAAPVLPRARLAPAPEPVVVLPPVEVLGSGRRQGDGLKPLRGSSATRTDTLLADLPQAVSVLTGDALDLQGSGSSTEAVRFISGVSSRVDLSGGQSVVPALMVRGLPALYALSGLGTIRGSLPVDTAFIDRIEVPKGPSGAISGVASMGGRGGVVNLVRKEAGVEPRREILHSGSSQDSGSARLEADMAGRAGPDATWRVVGFGDVTGATEGGSSGQGGAGLLASTRYRSGGLTTSLTVQGDRRRSAPKPVARGGAVQPDGSISPIAPGRVASLDAGELLDSTAADVELGLDWRIHRRWRATVKTRVEWVDNDLPRLQQAPRRNSWWNTVIQGGLAGDIDTGPVRHQLLLGVDSSHWRTRLQFGGNESGNVAPPARLDLRDVKSELLLQDLVHLGNLRARLAVQTARVPVFAAQGQARSEQRVVNWDAGVLYRLSHAVSAYAGSQSSTETDIVRAFGPAIFAGEGDLTATRQTQAGLKLDLQEDRLALTMEVFSTRQINSPNVNFGSVGQSGLFFNIPGRRVQGLELDLAGRPLAAWELQLGLSFMRATDELLDLDGTLVEVPGTGVPLRSMHLLSRVQLPWLPRTRLGLALRARSSSLVLAPTPGAPGVQLAVPGSAGLNLALEHRLGDWAISAFVRNVFDRDIYETQGPVGAIPLEPGRSLGVTATWRARGLVP